VVQPWLRGRVPPGPGTEAPDRGRVSGHFRMQKLQLTRGSRSVMCRMALRSRRTKLSVPGTSTALPPKVLKGTSLRLSGTQSRHRPRRGVVLELTCSTLKNISAGQQTVSSSAADPAASAATSSTRFEARQQERPRSRPNPCREAPLSTFRSGDIVEAGDAKRSCFVQIRNLLFYWQTQRLPRNTDP